MFSFEVKIGNNIKYLSVKLKKGLKNNSDIIYTAKDASELCVRILFFFMCSNSKDLEKIDFEFFRNSVNADNLSDDEIINALNFWREKKVLDYDAITEQNSKGANMDNIISIISSINQDITDMNTDMNESITIIPDDDPGFDIVGGRDKKSNKKTRSSSKEINEKTEKSVEFEWEIIETASTDGDIDIEEEDTGDSDQIETTEKTEIEIETETESEQPSINPANPAPAIISSDSDYINYIKAQKMPRSQPHSSSLPVSSASSVFSSSSVPAVSYVSSISIPPVSPPQAYSVPPISPVPIEKLSETLETKEDFHRLFHNAQIIMRSVFNMAELEILYNLYEINRIEVDLILKLAEECAKENKFNVRYLEKTVFGFASNGVTTLEQYHAMLEESLKLKEFEEKIKTMFNIRDKKLNTKEKNCIKTWVLEFDFTDDILLEGYNKSLEKDKFSIFYINGIYSNWYQKGFRTLEDIKNEYNQNGGLNINNKKESSFNLEQFFEKALQRSMKY